MRRATRVAGDERRGAGRRDMRELLFAERGGNFGKLRAEHAAETAALRGIGEFAHIAAARAREVRRGRSVAMNSAQMAGVVASDRGGGWRLAAQRGGVDLELRLKKLDELEGLGRERDDRLVVSGSVREERLVFLAHHRAAGARRRDHGVVGREDFAHTPSEYRCVSGQAVRKHRLSAAGLRGGEFDGHALMLEHVLEHMLKHQHRRLERARRERFGEAGGEEGDAHQMRKDKVNADGAPFPTNRTYFGVSFPVPRGRSAGLRGTSPLSRRQRTAGRIVRPPPVARCTAHWRALGAG